MHCAVSRRRRRKDPLSVVVLVHAGQATAPGSADATVRVPSFARADEIGGNARSAAPRALEATRVVTPGRCTAHQDPIRRPDNRLASAKLSLRPVPHSFSGTDRHLDLSILPPPWLAGRPRRRSRLRSQPVHNGAGGGVCPQHLRNLVRTGESSYSPYEIRSTGPDLSSIVRFLRRVADAIRRRGNPLRGRQRRPD